MQRTAQQAAVTLRHQLEREGAESVGHIRLVLGGVERACGVNERAPWLQKLDRPAKEDSLSGTRNTSATQINSYQTPRHHDTRYVGGKQPPQHTRLNTLGQNSRAYTS